MFASFQNRIHHADLATQRSAFSWSLFAATVVWCATYVGALEVPELLAHDAVLRLRNQFAIPDAHVLLVYLPPESDVADESTIEQLVDCLEELRVLNARAFVLPEELFAREIASQTDDIFVYRRAMSHSTRQGLYQARSTHHQPAINRVGVAAVDRPRRGVFRTQKTGYFDGYYTFPAIETLVANFMVPSASRVPQNSYRINFRGDIGSLPNVELCDITQKRITQSLVADRIVVFGRALPSGSLGMTTPTTQQVLGMSQLEYHGHALNTLVSQSAIGDVSLPLQLFIFMAVAGIAYIVGRAFRFANALVVYSLFVALTVIAALFALDAYALSLPLVAMSLCGALGLLRAMEFRQQLTSAMTTRMLADLSRRAGRRDIATAFATDTAWEQFASLLKLALPVQRLVCLAHEEQKLVAKFQLNCEKTLKANEFSLSQEPFVTAFVRRRTIKISHSSQSVLSDLPAQEVQFLVPLTTSSDVLGVLLVTLDSTALVDMPDLEQQLNIYADEMIDLLLQRDYYHAAIQNSSRTRFRYQLNSETQEQRRFSNLKRESAYLNSELSQFERLFFDSDSPAVVFDVFGDLMLTNDRMSQLLADGADGHRTDTAIEFLQAVASVPHDVCQEILRNVMTQHSDETLFATWAGRKWLVKIRALKSDRGQQRAVVVPTVFSTEAIVIELNDQSRFERLADMKLSQSEASIAGVRQSLNALDQCHQLLKSDLSDSQRFEVNELMQANLAAAVSVLDRTHVGQQVNEANDVRRCVATDIRYSLDLAAEEMNQHGRQHHVQFVLERPDDVGRVFGNPAYIKVFFERCLRLALADARRSTTVKIVVAIDDEFVHTVVSTQGTGMSSQELRSQLTADSSAGPEYSQFAECCSWLEEWGGRIVASGVIGQGLEIKTSFRRFD